MLTKSDIGAYQYLNNNPYQSSNIAGRAYTYDNNGNLTNDRQRNMVYDYMDRMTSVAMGGTTTNYYYDHSKTRVMKFNSATGAFTRYPNKYYEKSNDKENRYIFLGNQRLGIVEKPSGQSPTLYLNFTDHLNSSAVTTDNSGNITNLIDYYPYGSDRVNVQNQSFSPSYQFTDQEKDSESNLMYFDSRYYNAGIGRFTQTDELSAYVPYNYQADPQNLNEYAYARNNPINYTDPDGKFAILAALYVAATWVVTNLPAIITTGSALVAGSYAASQEGAAIGYALEGNYTSSNQCAENAIKAEVAAGAIATEAVALSSLTDTKSKQTKTATGKTDPKTSGAANAASKPKEVTPSAGAQASTITPGQTITSAEQVPGNVKNAIPQSWGNGQVSDNGKGWKWIGPNNKGYVRFGSGDPTSPYTNSQNPYIKINNANGQPLDKNGNVIVGYESPSKAPEAHIPLSEFNPSNYSFLNQ